MKQFVIKQQKIPYVFIIDMNFFIIDSLKFHNDNAAFGTACISYKTNFKI